MALLEKIQTSRGVDGLSAWFEQSSHELALMLAEHGALLFNAGEEIDAKSFEDILRKMGFNFYTKNGEHIPISESGVVQTPVFYPHQLKIFWHNENSFHKTFPGKIIFSCGKPAISGGETPLVDTRILCKLIRPDVLSRFKKRGVMYVRRYVKGLGLSYQKTLGVDTAAQAEAFCRVNDMSYSWSADVLKTIAIRPAVYEHPITGEDCFVAQGHHWHQSLLAPDVRNMLQQAYGRDNMPRDFRYGDGTEIEDEIMDELTELYTKLEVARGWKLGDLVIVDNTSVAHARNPYKGDRTLFVALADPLQFPVFTS